MKALLLKYRYFLLSVLFMVGALLLSAPNLSYYLRFSFEAIVGVLALPLIIRFNHLKLNNNRFFFFSLFFLLLYVWLKVQILFYFTVVSYVLFFAENAFGKVNKQLVFFFLFISPFFHFFVDAFGFPVRLHITKIAVNILSAILPEIKAFGNVIHCKGNEFSVDPECAGLNMIVLSLIVGLAIVSFHEKREKKEISFLFLCALLLFNLLLAIAANLFRVVSIILFEAFPGTVAHEIFGLISLVIYCFVPFYFVSGWLVKRVKMNFFPSFRVQEGTLKFAFLSFFILLFLIPVNIYKDEFRNSFADPEMEKITVKGFQKSVLENHVLQLNNPSCLVYIKPTVNFYGAHHSPLVCWKGGGYQLKNEQVKVVNGIEILNAEMITPKGEVFYTSWWFDNGAHQTISQFDWRFRMLKGEEAFRLVNVTSASREELNKNERLFLTNKLF